MRDLLEIPKGMPFDFVVDELETVAPVFGQMFGAYSIYVDNKIVLILRERDSSPESNGVWIATTTEHHTTLREEIPTLSDIPLFGPGPTGWQMLSIDTDSFEDDVLAVCKLIRKRDPRIGKIPQKRRSKVRVRLRAKTRPTGKKKAKLR